MSTVVAISLADAKATPETHNFSPVNRNGDVISYQDRSAGKPIGYNQLSLSFRGPVSKVQRSYKVSVKLVLPKVVTIGTGDASVDSLAYSNLASVDLVFHESSTLQERKNLVTMLGNALVNPSVASMVQDAAPLFG